MKADVKSARLPYCSRVGHKLQWIFSTHRQRVLTIFDSFIFGLCFIQPFDLFPVDGFHQFERSLHVAFFKQLRSPQSQKTPFIPLFKHVSPTFRQQNTSKACRMQWKRMSNTGECPLKRKPLFVLTNWNLFNQMSCISFRRLPSGASLRIRRVQTLA